MSWDGGWVAIRIGGTPAGVGQDADHVAERPEARQPLVVELRQAGDRLADRGQDLDPLDAVDAEVALQDPSRASSGVLRVAGLLGDGVEHRLDQQSRARARG